MGIPKFAYFLTNRYPLIVKKIKDETDVPPIDNLYLDFNGIIHNVSHHYFCDASKITSTTNEIYAEICEVINQIVHLIKPKNLLMISVDGVAPRAKMNQQRIRRFRKELNLKKEKEEQSKEIQENEIKDDKILFDSNAISPGTKFMFHLTYYLKNYISEQKKVNEDWMGIEVLLSGIDVPGEGEHKILEYIRNYKLSEKYNPYTKHCIYGLDADLIMLSLISHEYNFVILREDYFKMKKKEKEENGQANQEKYSEKKIEYQFFLISVLREYLELEFGYLNKKIKFKYDFEKIIDDFIFLCFFIGNDFLPNLFSFNIENGALTHLFDFYKACLPELDGYLTDKGKINFKRVLKLFDYLSKQELHSIDLMIRKNKDENKKERMKKTQESKEQIRLLLKQRKEEKKKKFFEDIKNKNKEEQNKIKKDFINKRILKAKKKYMVEDKYENEYIKYKELINKDSTDKAENKENSEKKENKENNENVLNENLKNFFSEIEKYDKYILDINYNSDFKEEDLNDSDISEVDINEVIQEVAKNNQKTEEIKENESEEDNDINIIFMQQIVKLKNAKEVKEFYYKEKLKINLKEEQGIKDRDKIFNKYLEGLQWILYYYYNSIKSWKWFYPYHYAPMISDYQEIHLEDSLYNMYDIFDKDKSEPFNPYQSLLFILPKESFYLLPECYKDIPNILKEYFPDKIEIDYNGKIAEYESLLLLPVLEEDKMLEAEIKCRKLSPEEENENKWGTSYLFNKNKTPNENIICNNYEIYQKNTNNIKSTQNVIKKCDFSFPTLKTIDYDYQLMRVKQYFGKTSYITKQIAIYPQMAEKINLDKICKYLEFKAIFIDYPFKAFGELVGFIYSKAYHYLYNYMGCDYLYIDYRYRLTNEVIESIRYKYQKMGIILNHPEILCDVRKLQKIENKDGQIITIFEDNEVNYVPFEITSLNATSKDYLMYISKINKTIGGNYRIYKNEKLYFKSSK